MESRDKQQQAGKHLIDTETGEILQENVAYSRTFEQQEAWKRKQEEQETERLIGQPDFTFGDMEEYKSLMGDVEMGEKELNYNQIGYFYLLTTYLGYDGFIRLTKEQDPITTRKAIGSIIGLSSNGAIKRNVDALIDNDLMFEEEFTNKDGKTKKGFKLNTDYSYKGKLKDTRAVKSFSRTIRDIYEDDGADAVSFIVAILSYIGLEDNVICANPYEQDTDKIQPLTKKDIAEITGFSLPKVSKKINHLKYKDMYVIATIKKGQGKTYVVNPLAIYRQNGTPPRSLVRQFKIK